MFSLFRYLPMAGNTETAVSVAMKFIGPKDGYEGTPSKVSK